MILRQRAWKPGKVDVDLFAGGGGASEGKRRATGRSPDVAANHWPAACFMHEANHPDCVHFVQDVHDVVPLIATGGRWVRNLWASPTCTDFSRASGKRLSPDTIKIRSLANCLFPWIEQVRPDFIYVENVIEFLQWGPVCWEHVRRCRGAHDASGKSCSKRCQYGRPIKARRGEHFTEWVTACRSYGYSVEWRVLKAWEHGAPTTRERLYVVMCADGQPYTWPEATHVRPELAATTGKKPWRTAAEIIDWSLPCPSIFDRKKPHVPATRRRLARGMRKFVLEADQPFLIHTAHGDVDRHGKRRGRAEHGLDKPIGTICAGGTDWAVGVPSFVLPVKTWGGGGNEPRSMDMPMRTSLLRYNGQSTGQRHDEPIGTIDAKDRFAQLEYPLAAATEWNDIVAAKARRVYRFLRKEGVDGPWMDHENQLVWMPGTDLVIWDIGMRMLVPRELFRANGFGDDYVIDLIGPRGKPLTKTEQVRLAGNSVCPDVAEALFRAALARPPTSIRRSRRPREAQEMRMAA